MMIPRCKCGSKKWVVKENPMNNPVCAECGKDWCAKNRDWSKLDAVIERKDLL